MPRSFLHYLSDVDLPIVEETRSSNEGTRRILFGGWRRKTLKVSELDEKKMTVKKQFTCNDTLNVANVEMIRQYGAYVAKSHPHIGIVRWPGVIVASVASNFPSTSTGH
ncbi:hypothetical protein KIN20_000564 [Parelaphostrongylus tenuis]|uniref:Uncharacterized protein n=1 Tax=Parelaphostrongylus tenuis TaxID=148309 RepID=A0AAD5QDZ0_PARTN|nr:hypothetical protein KIN20_000564 [Parelaphostrongylus tenuis]